ncbi:hypothetical protein [Sulfurovum sp. NBC37-1]|uniref:hypothetical protein n=1 Tax=Sulfurovum sp. (strain NBC37-1) TaxID=387093 RepID=UPI00015874D7|nr:hypothetical protein [Sulfurovum sp. NBC37-1]BAF71783.1 hypothetical protein SUN_0825 [Sulfurovum sp. NBC37-1]
MRSIDISYLDEGNHAYAVHLATKQQILSYKNGIFRLADIPDANAFEAVDFWRNASLSAEILLKACLLRHHIPFFRKRAHGEYGNKVTAHSNAWLSQTLKELQISYIAEINTGTISTALRSAEETLFEKVSFPSDKTALISEMIYIIIRTRRNRNSHFFFPNQGHIEISEVEMLYLPLLNLLEELWNTPETN